MPSRRTRQTQTSREKQSSMEQGSENKILPRKNFVHKQHTTRESDKEVCVKRTERERARERNTQREEGEREKVETEDRFA